MILKTTLLGKTYTFRDIKDVLAKANEEKTGDRLAGLAAGSAQERIAAKVVLSALELGQLREHPAVPYEEDEVTRIIQDDVNEREYARIRGWTVAQLREWILAETTTGADIRRLSRGLTAEMVAAVCKLMSNLDLIYAAAKITVTAHCNTTIGLPGTLSCRLQPNHTTDDPDGITASTLEGLSFGAGDAVIGLNPVTDSPEQVGKILRRFQLHCRKSEGQRGLWLPRGHPGRGPAAAAEGGNGGGTQRHVLRDRSGIGAVLQRPPRYGPGDHGGPVLRLCQAVFPVPGEYGGGLHRPGVPL